MGVFEEKEEVSARELRDDEIELIQNNSDLVKQLNIPQLFDLNNPNSRIFIAFADGTNNDLSDSSKFTNVAKLFIELKEVIKNNPNIAVKYVPGVGTQDNRIVSTIDGMIPFSFIDRANELYKSFSYQANEWKRENPDAEIAIVEVGFSRGCGVAVYLNNKIDRNGVLASGETLYADGKEEYSKEKLIEPGEVKQAVVLYDPVVTAMFQPVRFKDVIDGKCEINISGINCTLSDSTISGIQFKAKDENRWLFGFTNYIGYGLSPNRNFIGLTYPGAHSDIGGSYNFDKYVGIGVITRNLVNQYMNCILGNDLLKTHESPKVDECGIHNPEEHRGIYKLRLGNSRSENDLLNQTILKRANYLVANNIKNTQAFSEVVAIEKSSVVEEKKAEYQGKTNDRAGQEKIRGINTPKDTNKDKKVDTNIEKNKDNKISADNKIEKKSTKKKRYNPFDGGIGL
jgi:hypothetical protein